MSLIGIFILLFFVNIAIIIYRSPAAQAFEVFSMIKVAALKASGGAFMLLHHHSTHPPILSLINNGGRNSELPLSYYNNLSSIHN